MFQANKELASYFRGDADQIYCLSNPIQADIFYVNKKFNCLTKKFSQSSPKEIESELARYTINSFEKNIYPVIHLFYEFGGAIHSDDYQGILAIILRYQNKAPINLNLQTLPPNISFQELKSPSYSNFKKAFNLGLKYLKQGDIYQYNYTDQWHFSFSKALTPYDFLTLHFSQIKKLGALAHATYVPDLNKLFLSNTPEYLFKISKQNIFSMPIKGTIKNDQPLSALINSVKNESELFMITDLIRNDLSKIELPRAQVIARKKILSVPGLYHTYSIIKCPLSLNVSLKEVVEAIFPGGSITGAPKKSAVLILNQLEKKPRGFYCGSTIIFNNQKKQCIASINIRSSEVDFNSKKLMYSAGAGITLRSRMNEEWDEINAKLQSYFHVLLNRIKLI